MIEYLEEITGHSYHAAHQELEKKIAEVGSTLEDLSEDARFYLERLHDINMYVKHRINSVDPMFLPKSQLDAFDSYTKKQIDQIDAYLSNRPFGSSYQALKPKERPIEYLVKANDSANQSLTQLGSIPYPQTSGDVEQMRDNIVTFRKSVGQQIRNVQGEFSKIQEGVKNTENNMQKVVSTVDIQKQRVDTVVADYQKQFSSGEDTRREAFTSAEEKRANVFSESESKRQESFETEIVSRKAELDEIVKTAASNSEVMSERFEMNAGEVLLRLDKYRLEAEILVGVIGSKGIIHGYQAVANEEAKTGRRWEKFAVGSMGLLILFGLYAFWLAHLENFNWHFLAARAMAAIPLGVFAAYAAHKAEQHREVERNARRMELELAAINPYLATLPPETQYEVKRLLAERYFANDGSRVETVRLPEQTGNPSELLKPVLENLKLVLEAITKK